eukprot:365294-Chlamydomonas_euryale.AAC.1
MGKANEVADSDLFSSASLVWTLGGPGVQDSWRAQPASAQVGASQSTLERRGLASSAIVDRKMLTLASSPATLPSTYVLLQHIPRALFCRPAAAIAMHHIHTALPTCSAVNEGSLDPCNTM